MLIRLSLYLLGDVIFMISTFLTSYIHIFIKNGGLAELARHAHRKISYYRILNQVQYHGDSHELSKGYQPLYDPVQSTVYHDIGQG